MVMADELDGVVDSTGMVRRSFVRRLVTGTVFAVPVVSSFAMAGVEAASASAHGRYPGPPQGNPNQTLIANPNQPCGLGSPIGGPNQSPYGVGGSPFGFGGNEF
jgi:hypothetical protein